LVGIKAGTNDINGSLAMLVLSLFPGIGLLDMAFEEEGFCVVRGPDLLWGGDIRGFHPPKDRFDGVIGGPPCQIFSRMRHINPKAGQAHGNMIPEFERCVSEAEPAWFLMENVPEAPEPEIWGYVQSAQMIRDVWVGGETSRMRRFSFGARTVASKFQIDTLALHKSNAMPAALAGGARRVPVKIGGSGKVKASRRVRAGDLKTEEGFAASKRAQGLPDDFDLPPFTVAAKVKAVGNGVPLAMGRAVARAVQAALTEG
jgi:DNA (cytosine-5)-methyltransferase 1